MGTTLEFLLEPCGGIGGGFCVGAAHGRGAGVTMGTALVVFLVTSDFIGCGPVEGAQYVIDVNADKDNLLGQNKERRRQSNTGIWNLCGP